MVADIPGLIEGPAKAKAWGMSFYGTSSALRSYYMLWTLWALTGWRFGTRRRTLRRCAGKVMAYSEAMKAKASLIAVNKIDLVSSLERRREIEEELKALSDAPVFLISAQMKAGLDELIDELFRVTLSNRASAGAI